MRASLRLSIVLATALAACGQSLTPNKTGTGGVATGTGLGPGDTGEGGSISGVGGTGGSSTISPACNQIDDQYQQAIATAETCQVGASGQCGKLVGESLSACTCAIYVNDTSLLTPIQNLWNSTACSSGVQPPCIPCPAALNRTCVAVDGGSTGVCTYVPGDGGPGGSPDADASLCNGLVSDYAAALAAAKSCTTGAADPCATSVPEYLSPCGACPVYVNDSTTLDAIRLKWDQAGCDVGTFDCPEALCILPTAGNCAQSDAGGSVCVSY